MSLHLVHGEFFEPPAKHSSESLVLMELHKYSNLSAVCTTADYRPLTAPVSLEELGNGMAYMESIPDPHHLIELSRFSWIGNFSICSVALAKASKL
jgi:hypothetical protein